MPVKRARKKAASKKSAKTTSKKTASPAARVIRERSFPAPGPNPQIEKMGIPSTGVVKLDKLPRFTGRQIVLLNQDSSTGEIEKKARTVSMRMASSRDFKSMGTAQPMEAAFKQADGIVFDRLKIAIVNQDHGEQLTSLTTRSATRRHFRKSEPERYVYKTAKASRRTVTEPFEDDSIATWGVHAVNALNSGRTGKGINVAILDTGFDIGHPDFKSRIKDSVTFIRGQAVKDQDGHGTHCTGISCGNLHKAKQFRYGVASEANIFIAKVLSNTGVGTDSSIIAGIEWALEQKCKVISMSLGGSVAPGETFYESYESVAKTALKNNCIIIAAAGNDSERSKGLIEPVNHPANCPGIMAVAAVDSGMDIADFSCAGLFGNGGQIDIAAPGVDIYSSYKNHRYRRLDGTSMATPFVAGLAALLWEASPRSSAESIWMKLVQFAKRLNLSAADVGAGLACFR